MTLTVLHGDCRDVLRTLPAESVQTVVTSPPYFGLRDYGVTGQIGLEQTPAEYVETLVEVFREIRRVLRKDGTVWLNLGDSYGHGTTAPGKRNKRDGYDIGTHALSDSDNRRNGLAAKQLLGIPWRVAFALQADGWWLRSEIIWHKPNPMPESVLDRPTRSHEQIFLLTKSANYFYDADAIREDRVEPDRPTDGFRNGRAYIQQRGPQANSQVNVEYESNGTNPIGRNKRTVWTVATQPLSEAHFATFPERLIEPCILAGTSPQACEHCGAPWERITQRDSLVGSERGTQPSQFRANLKPPQQSNVSVKVETLGWQPTCTCEGNTGSGNCIVLDPFAGSGTTLRVAAKHRRSAIGIELNADYISIADKRTNGVQTMMDLPA